MPYCFYCGSSTHYPEACNVKRLDNIADMQNKTTDAIKSLGYSSWEQVDTLVREQDKLVEAQERSADRIADAISRKTDAIHELSATVDTSISQVTEVLYGLSIQFRQAHDEVMWKAEQQAYILTGIHDMMANPRGTEAEELLRMGKESLKIGMVDETLNLLEEAVEKNPLDYRIYVTMGYAYIDKNEPENAINRFEYALRNARSEDYRTRALMLMARTKYIMEDFAGAIQTVKKVVNISPDYSEAHYRLAGYYAANGEADEAIRCLQYIIEGGKTIAGNTIKADRDYFIKARIDPEFSNSRDEINTFLQELLQKEKELAQEAIKNAKTAFQKAREWHVNLSNANVKLSEAKKQYETQSYFGYQDAQPLAGDAELNAKDVMSEQRSRMRKKAQSSIEDAQKEINNAEADLQALTEPQKQLEIQYEPNKHIQTAKDKLAESQRFFDMDTYSGYLQAQENAKEAQDKAAKISEQIIEFQILREDAQTAIAQAKSVLDSTEEASEQKAAPDKFQTAQEKLTEARRNFELGTKSGYSRARETAEQVGILADEIRIAKKEAELMQLREEAQDTIKIAEKALRNIRFKKSAQYLQTELKEVQEKLDDACGKFELNTRQAYCDALKIAQEINSSEIDKLIPLANQRESEHRQKMSKVRRYSIILAVIGFIICFGANFGGGEIIRAIGGGIVGAIIGFFGGLALGQRKVQD